jgi:hypothetical protein
MHCNEMPSRGRERQLVTSQIIKPVGLQMCPPERGTRIERRTRYIGNPSARDSCVFADTIGVHQATITERPPTVARWRPAGA